MKLTLFFLTIILNISLINSSFVDYFFRRNAASSSKLMLVAIGNLTDGENFKLYFKKYNDFELDALNLTPLVTYFNESTFQANSMCTLLTNENNYFSTNNKEDELIYSCNISLSTENSTKIALNNQEFNFYNSTNNKITDSPEIIFTPLAEEISKNIYLGVDELNLVTFYFDNITINNSQAVINGKTDIEGEAYYNLSLSEEEYNCTVDSTTIKFNLDKDVNDKLIGKILYNETGPAILIFTNDTKEDSILYSKKENSYIDLIGFGNYEKQENKNATNKAYFRGSINNLKKFIRFHAKVIYGDPSLRLLEEQENVTASGERDTVNLTKGEVTYKITFEKTANMTNIKSIESFNDYKFSENGETFTDPSAIINIIPENLNLTNKEKITIENCNFSLTQATLNVGSKSFSFDFNFPKTSQKLNITGKKTAYLSYHSLDYNKRDDIQCTVENKTNRYTFICEPKKNVYTLLKSLIFKIPYPKTSRRLRFLDEAGNSTFYADPDASGLIDYTYQSDPNIFNRKTSGRNGLSAGAIVAIVLATVAAVAAVGVAFFFLNKPSTAPAYNYPNVDIQNSATNINK